MDNFLLRVGSKKAIAASEVLDIPIYENPHAKLSRKTGMVRVTKYTVSHSAGDLKDIYKDLYRLDVLQLKGSELDEDTPVATVNLRMMPNVPSKGDISYSVSGFDEDGEHVRFSSPVLHLEHLDMDKVKYTAQLFGQSILTAKAVSPRDKRSIYDAGKKVLDVFCDAHKQDASNVKGELFFSLKNRVKRDKEYFLVKIDESNAAGVSHSHTAPFRGTLSLYQTNDKREIISGEIAKVTFTDKSLKVKNRLLGEFKVSESGRLELLKGGEKDNFNKAVPSLMFRILDTIHNIDSVKRRKLLQFLADPRERFVDRVTCTIKDPIQTER